MNEAIHLENVTYFYPRSGEPALKDISVSIDYGEFVVVAGPSGGGKSTLCKIIVGLIPHLYGGNLIGKVYVDGVEVSEIDIKTLVEKIGVVFQNPENQIVNLVVEEELAFALENFTYRREEIDVRVSEIVRKLSIEHLRNRSTFELSGGETQKVVLGSVLAVRPRIIILDEPLAHLDPPAVQELMNFLKYLNEVEDKTIVVVEHRLTEVLKHASRLIVLDKTVIADGSPKEVLKKFENIDIRYGVEIPPISRLSTILDLGEPVISIEEALEKIRNKNFVINHDLRYEDNNGNDHYCCKRSEKIIEVLNLWYVYDNGVEALKDVNLSICRGEFVAIIGGNGSGKTTLIKHFNGLLKPTKGRVRVLGLDTLTHSVAELSRYVGLVFQNPLYHFSKDTVYEEVLFVAKTMGLSNADEKSKTLLRKLGLLHLASRSPYEISAGEQRRLAIASALIYDPEILVLDEPTAGIDYRHKLELLEILISMWQSGKTIIMTSHDIEFLALTPAEKVIVMDRGKVIAIGNPKKVFYNLLPKKLEVFLPQLVKFVKDIGFNKSFKPLNVEELAKILHGKGYAKEKNS